MKDNDFYFSSTCSYCLTIKLNLMTLVLFEMFSSFVITIGIWKC